MGTVYNDQVRATSAAGPVDRSEQNSISASHEFQRHHRDRTFLRHWHRADAAAGQLHGARVQGREDFSSAPVLPFEKLVYKLTGVDSAEEMTWLRYLWAVVDFWLGGRGFADGYFHDPAMGAAVVNPQELSNVSWNMAFNEAWSFICNADWQDYSGESTYSYFSQVCGVMVHQFISGSTGLAILVACGRALKRASVKSIGNFWVDVTRCMLYITLPLSALLGIFLAWQGVPQTLGAYPTATLVEPYNNQIPKVDDKGNPVTTKVAGDGVEAQARRAGPARQRPGRQTGDGGRAEAGRQRPAGDDRPAGDGGQPRGLADDSARPASRRSSPSSNSSPTAAAGMASTARIPLKTRRRSRTSSNCWPSSSCRWRRCICSACWSATSATPGACLR